MLSGKAITNIVVGVLIFWERCMGFEECIVGECLVIGNG